ncbi:MAG: helix-turn-helix domain-containing protein [Candidatus Cloacimonetes bacterium]|nr:helix-turn-helix domain-containing protein [Candidatus Cloacimonadota bacterium]
MENIGNYLQEKRKEKGLSLDEVSSKTKLHVNTLKNMESNNFSSLGGDGYTKILITTYARVLGLSQREIDTLLNKAPKIDIKAPRQSNEILHPKTILIHKNFFLVILLIILIAVLTYAVVTLYESEKISWPFSRTPTPVEEPEPLQEDEPLEQDSENLDINTYNTIYPSDPEDNLSGSDSEEPIRFMTYTTDRTDYLTYYNICNENIGGDNNREYFTRYVCSF